MVQLVLTSDEATVCEAVGVRAFVQARAVVARGDLTDVQWDQNAAQGQAVVRGATGQVTASVVVGPDNAIKSINGSCTCNAAHDCAHPSALVLIAFASDTLRPQPVASWELALTALLGVDSPSSVPGSPELALQFEVEGVDGRSQRRIGLRPAVPGKKGWVRAGISWSSLAYSFRSGSPRTRGHVDLLRELLALADAEKHDPYGYRYYGSAQRVLYLDEFRSPRVWDILSDAQEAGLPMVQGSRATSLVTVAAQPVQFSVRADRDDTGLRLRPVLADGAEIIDPGTSILVGSPAHGIAWWATTGQVSTKDPVMLRIAPLARPVSAQVVQALTAPAIVVPAADESRFLRQYYPGLMLRADVVSDESAALPDIRPATLTLNVQRLPGHRASLDWEWVSVVGTHILTEPLHSGVDRNGDRAGTLRKATDLLADRAYGLIEPLSGGRQLRSHAVVAGDVMLRLVRDVFPKLAETDGLDVVFRPDEELPDYVELEEAPLVSFKSAAEEVAGQRDWFDLSVRITVGGEDVGFEELFVALAAEQEFMILPSGRYFRLDQPEFRQLQSLIAEARELGDAPAGVLRVGRFQAGLWQELSELGEITGQAATWQESVRALGAAGTGSAATFPQGLSATFRPYQVEGFQWLAALYRHELGGVLADDMGLGKTLQALALICHAVEQSRAEAPFLVVAPASVVSNWSYEAGRFASELRVHSIVETGRAEARRWHKRSPEHTSLSRRTPFFVLNMTTMPPCRGRG